MADKPDNQIDWLLENGNPVVRFRTARELVADYPTAELETLKQELLQLPQVQTWLARLDLGEMSNRLEKLDERSLRRLGNLSHGSKRTCLENVLGKLAELGLRAGMVPLDERVPPLMRIFRWQGDWQTDRVFQSAWESLVKSTFAWGLLRAGYAPDPPMSEFLRNYLELVHKIARDQVFDLYADSAELVGLPKAWAGKPILKQEVMAHYHLPWIHDISVLAHFPPDLLDGRAAQMIEEIIAYILDPRFQAVPDGYGYAWIKERRTCYGWGWSPHLPEFFGIESAQPYQVGVLVQRLELMAHFPLARRSDWFQKGIQHLEQFRTDQGTYNFPRNYLPERPDGYYVTGVGMGLGEDRRKKNALEIESTFRMALIRKILSS